MKSYVVRKQLRTAVQGIVSYPVNGKWTTGTVWDISRMGYRTTGEYPLPTGFETIIFLTLRKGEDLHHILIESAIVRWTDGRHAGWEIQRMDALSHVHLADVMKQADPSVVPLEGVLITA